MQSTARGISLGFETIVVATDFSEFAHRALLKTVELAQGSTSKVILTHVIDPLLYATALNGAPFLAHQIERDARERLELCASVLRRQHVACELVVLKGILRDCLSRLIEDRRANLLVVGTHGETRFNRDVCGSIAEKILRVAPCPVMIVGPLSRPAVPVGTQQAPLLFATAFSAHSVSVLPFADALAHRMGSELHLLHVAPRAANRPELSRNLMEKLEQVARTHVCRTAKVHCLVQHGALGETIASVAKSIGAMAIVVAVQDENLRRKPVGGLNHGRVFKIMSQMDCPVITLHSGLDKGILQSHLMDEVLLTA